VGGTIALADTVATIAAVQDVGPTRVVA
jgi:hypothetical protein